MKINDILRDESGLTVRVLVLLDSVSWVVNCDHCRMPFTLDNAILAAMMPVDEKEYYTFYTDEELNARQKEIRDSRYSLIQPLLTPECVVDKTERNKHINILSLERKINVKTIKNYLWRYWVAQSPNALLPQKRPDKEDTQLSLDQKNIRWALNKFYYTTKRHTLKTAYTLMLKEKYTDTLGTLYEQYPSFYQFRYFFYKHRDPVNEIISRQGLKAYQRNHRAFTGGVREYADKAGIFMTDATIADLYIVSRFSRKVIGRPIIYTMVDAHTNLITGLYVGLEGGKHGLRMLLANTVMDKAAYCKQHGITIEPEQWPSHHLPYRILTDRGTEFVGDVLENLCAEYGIEIVNLPAYRPDLKGNVEKLFDLLQTAYKPHLIGKGIIRSDFQERGGHDYRKDSTLDLEQFTAIVIKCVLFYNSEHIMKNYPRTVSQMAADVPPVPSKLWIHSQAKPGGKLRTVDARRFLLALLPRTNGGFTQKGLEVFGVHYDNSDFATRFVLAGIKGKEKVVVAYNPNDLSTVYLYENMVYTPFDVVQNRYRGKTLVELMQLKKDEKAMVSKHKKQELQAQISLIADIEDIASQAIPMEQQTIKAISSGIRANRSVEKRQEKSIFELLQGE